MIITFSIENWMSFREKTELSMLAGGERRFNNRVPRINNGKTRLLPIASLYGGNASGKSNLFKAFKFIKNLATNPIPLGIDQEIPVNPYRLDDESLQKPSCFELVFLVDETLYAYAFSATKTAIVSETLTEIKSNQTETLLFKRENNTFDFTGLCEKRAFKGREKTLDEMGSKTRNNVLFLHRAVDDNEHFFKPIYDWFDKTLVLIGPTDRSPMRPWYEINSENHERLVSSLRALDTGIDTVGVQNISGISLDDIKQNDKRLHAFITNQPNFQSVIHPEGIQLKKTDSGLEATLLRTTHTNHAGEPVNFKLTEESDGTQRLFELLPVLLMMKNHVVFIDEIDNSLHALLTETLIRNYLYESHQDVRHQLIFTTHDLSLMDQSLFRRDELWVTERDATGASSLTSFSEYVGITPSTNLRKLYRLGRIGGTPKL
jgi:AAA15 family ATPase/GTPase